MDKWTKKLAEYKMIEPGDIIISSPYADTGMVFSKSVIYIISHDHTGTSGVIINKLLQNIDGRAILKVLNLEQKNYNIENELPVYFGGPIEQEKGIILHSSDYEKNSLNCGNKEISVSIDANIIQDIIIGNGPLYKMLILGYTAWSPNQLLDEIKRNDWLLPLNALNKKIIYDLIFLEEHHSRWSKALEFTGVTLSNYNNITGNA